MGSTLCMLLTFLVSSQWFARSEEVLNGKFGSLHSPNYPKEYDNNLNLTWAIRVRPGFRIKLQFAWFDIEDSFDEHRGGACVYDYVTVVEGERILGRFCGNSKERAYDAPRLRRWIYTLHENAIINFVSDFSNGEMHPTGFKAHFVEIDIDECAVLAKKQTAILEDWDKLLTCNHFCHNVPGSYYCTCRYGFTLHENKHTCVAAFCENQHLTENSGTIQSPDYPRNYAKLSHCSWTIKVEAGLSIHIAFDQNFAIESHFVEGCVYDTLALIYTNKTRTYCGEFGGKWAPNGLLMDMQTNELTVKLDTDLALEMKGFSLTYNTTKIRCLKEINAPQHGSIVSDLSKGYHEFKDVVQFTCDRGYDLIGTENISCLNDGAWDHAAPICRIKSCGAPQALLDVPNSHIVKYNETKTTYLAKVVVSCNVWYEMVGGTPHWICENEKKWIQNGTVVAPTDGNLPVCKPICGVKGKSKTGGLRTHIAGGTPVTEHEFPWTVLLTFRDAGVDSQQVCGGSLISPHYVLTAAHCLNETVIGHHLVNANTTTVWVGVHDREKPASSGAKKMEVSEIIIHPQYNKASLWDFDVALLRLSHEVVMTDAYRPICLPSEPDHFEMATPGKYGTIVGWGGFGAVGFDAISSMTLQQADFPVVSNKTCWQAYKNQTVDSGEDMVVRLTENMLCAGLLHRSSTCGGDSGGPFTMRNETTNIHYQVGLVSFGVSKCARQYLYSAYAKLNEGIVSWIMNTTNNLK